MGGAELLGIFRLSTYLWYVSVSSNKIPGDLVETLKGYYRTIEERQCVGVTTEIKPMNAETHN